jgi:hypothetical protein
MGTSCTCSEAQASAGTELAEGATDLPCSTEFAVAATSSCLLVGRRCAPSEAQATDGPPEKTRSQIHVRIGMITKKETEQRKVHASLGPAGGRNVGGGGIESRVRRVRHSRSHLNSAHAALLCSGHRA